MSTSSERGGERAAPPPPPPGPPKLSRRDALELRSARIPFTFKLVAVWAVILGSLVALFAAADFDTVWMREHAGFIARGITWTMVIAVLSIALASLLALLGALGRLSHNAIAVGVTGFYTSFFRGTPLIVQLFLIYLALPQIGIALGDPWADLLTLDVLTAGVLALGLNYGAYMTEIFRGGIQSVGHGQSEAAEALGMTYVQKMRRVVLPQALRVIIPPTGNEFIAMMKDTALVGFLGASIDQMEIFRRAQLVGKADFRNLEALLVAALMYWGLTTIFQYFQLRLERRLSKGYVRGTAGVAVAGQRRSTADAT
ncbi:MAG TPA: amino acid ABC transporter permease [Gaiellaceae bacterium]|nr:amino acid ABC transporter permease [Gaiellaceae bacterium]